MHIVRTGIRRGIEQRVVGPGGIQENPILRQDIVILRGFVTPRSPSVMRHRLVIERRF